MNRESEHSGTPRDVKLLATLLSFRGESMSDDAHKLFGTPWHHSVVAWRRASTLAQQANPDPVMLACSTVMKLDGSVESLLEILRIINDHVKSRHAQDPPGTHIPANERIGTVAFDAMCVEPNPQVDEEGWTHNLIENFQITPAILAAWKRDPALRDAWLREESPKLAARFIHAAVWVPIGEGPIIPLKAEVSRNGSVDAKHAGPEGFYGSMCENFKTAISQWNASCLADEQFLWERSAADGAYRGLI